MITFAGDDAQRSRHWKHTRDMTIMQYSCLRSAVMRSPKCNDTEVGKSVQKRTSKRSAYGVATEYVGEKARLT